MFAAPSQHPVRRAAAALTVAGATLFGGFSAAAQQAALSPQQCDNAVKIAASIVQSNRQAMSPELHASFMRFAQSNCDLNTEWRLINGNDERIFGEFRVRLVVLRTADARGPQVLAKQ